MDRIRVLYKVRACFRISGGHFSNGKVSRVWPSGSYSVPIPGTRNHVLYLTFIQGDEETRRKGDKRQDKSALLDIISLDM